MLGHEYIAKGRPDISRFQALEVSLLRGMDDRRDDPTLQTLSEIVAGYAQESGLYLCYVASRDLAKRMLDAKLAERLAGDVRLWYGEKEGMGKVHAVAVFQTSDAAYYLDVIGFRPFGLQPGITAVRKNAKERYTDRPFRQWMSPPLQRLSPQLQNEGKPAGNEILFLA